MSIKNKISHNLLNIPGWHTKRHIVVIESDDWGSIRMPSREVYDSMLAEGIRVDKDPYCRYDGLATSKDLEDLFDVLTSVKDKNGQYAVITADAVVANPDFEKIEASGFTEYYYEPFTETLKKSSRHQGAFELWKQGMDAGIFHPQFHGREHLNIKKWLMALRSDDGITRRAFDYRTYGLTSAVDSRINRNYMGAFDSALPEDIESYKQILEEGLELFENIFGYRSESFIATTYTWSPLIEPILKQNGVRYLQGTVKQRVPIDEGLSFKYKNTNFQGRKSNSGLTYLMRNCFFEPSQSIISNPVDDCLNRIALAFRWGKAAVISSHRLNFIGSIDKSNTDKNLPLFRELLQCIVKQWSDVEFMSSDQLGKIIENE